MYYQKLPDKVILRNSPGKNYGCTNNREIDARHAVFLSIACRSIGQMIFSPCLRVNKCLIIITVLAIPTI